METPEWLSRSAMREENPADDKSNAFVSTPFEGIEVGEEYRSTTTSQEEVLKVEAFLDGEMVFREMDSKGKPISVYSEEDWQPSRWEAL